MRAAPLRIAAGLAAPPRCGVCEMSCRGVEVLCGGCAAELAAGPALIGAGPAPLVLAVAAGAYTGVRRELVRRLKFERRLALAGPAAAAIARACPRETLAGALVPVPPAPWRRRVRGFDSAEEIALALAALTGLPLRRCLRRGSGPRQVGRPRSVRIADPPRVTARGAVPERALLVDDVRTTGATLSACARALRDGGSVHVAALTLARS